MQLDKDKKYIIANIEIVIEIGIDNSLNPLSDKIKLKFLPFNENDDLKNFIVNPDLGNELKCLLASILPVINDEIEKPIDTDIKVENISLKNIKTTNNNNISFKQRPSHSSRFTNKRQK